MSLIGTIDTLALADLFEVLAATHKTGALHVRSEQGLGIVYFTTGKVCGGEAGHRSGPVEGRPALVARLFDVCFDLFRFEEAAFEFDLEGRPTWPAGDTIEVGEILAETTRRLAEWEEIRTTVPSLDVRPRLASEAPGDSVTLDAAQWRVLAAIDGRRRINALVRVLDGNEFEVCRTLARLVEGGLVLLDAPDPAAVRPEGSEGDSPLAEAVLEVRRPLLRPSRLAAFLDEETDSEGDGREELDLWDAQVLATGVGRDRNATRAAVVAEADGADDEDDDEDDFVPEHLAEDTGSDTDDDSDDSADGVERFPAGEPEVVTAS